jgi:predicted transcriptional regulator
MLTDFKTLAPEQTLADATRLLLAGSQQDFPVVRGGSVAGILPHRELFLALRDQGEHALVANVMRREFVALSADAPLEAALAPENVERGLTMPVLEEGRLVGLVTAENVGEFFMIRSALHARAGSGTIPAPPRPVAPPVIRPPGKAPPPLLPEFGKS